MSPGREPLSPCPPCHEEGTVEEGLCSSSRAGSNGCSHHEPFTPSSARAHHVHTLVHTTQHLPRLPQALSACSCPALLCSRKGFSHEFPVASWDPLLKKKKVWCDLALPLSEAWVTFSLSCLQGGLIYGVLSNQLLSHYQSPFLVLQVAFAGTTRDNVHTGPHTPHRHSSKKVCWKPPSA